MWWVAKAMKDKQRVSLIVMEGELEACRTSSDERPCFFQIELPVLWKESSEAGFLVKCASSIVGWCERTCFHLSKVSSLSQGLSFLCVEGMMKRWEV